MLEVEPYIERRLGWYGHLQAQPRKTLEHMITLVLEVLLQRNLLLMDMGGLKQGDRHELETKPYQYNDMNDLRHVIIGEPRHSRMVSTTIEEGTRLRKCGDQVLRSEHPSDTEAEKTPVLHTVPQSVRPRLPTDE